MSIRDRQWMVPPAKQRTTRQVLWTGIRSTAAQRHSKKSPIGKTDVCSRKIPPQYDTCLLYTSRTIFGEGVHAFGLAPLNGCKGQDTAHHQQEDTAYDGSFLSHRGYMCIRDRHTAVLCLKKAAEFASHFRAHRDVLQIRLGGADASGTGFRLLKDRVTAAVRPGRCV